MSKEQIVRDVYHFPVLDKSGKKFSVNYFPQVENFYLIPFRASSDGVVLHSGLEDKLDKNSFEGLLENILEEIQRKLNQELNECNEYIQNKHIQIGGCSAGGVVSLGAGVLSMGCFPVVLGLAFFGGAGALLMTSHLNKTKIDRNNYSNLLITQPHGIESLKKARLQFVEHSEFSDLERNKMIDVFSSVYNTGRRAEDFLQQSGCCGTEILSYSSGSSVLEDLNKS